MFRLPHAPRSELFGSAAVFRAVLVALSLSVLAVGCSDESRRSPRARDVVVIVVDGLRADRVSALGGRSACSPSIDAFSRDGVVYARATSPATWCVPAYGSLLTGRWPSFHGAERAGDGERQHARDLDADAVTLGEVLAGAGFHAAAFAESDSGLAPARGLARGFETFDVVDDDHPLAARIGAWLAAHPEPAFLLVGIGGPDRLDEPTTGAKTPVAIGGGAALARGVGESDRSGDDLSLRYERAVAAADRAVGEVLATLREARRYDDSLVVVTADHGKLLGEHGMVADGRPPFEPQVHVPLIVKHAGWRRAGEWVDRRVSTLGVFATVLEATGIAPRPGAQSKPLDDLHPVWIEEIDPSGVRLRAGYDGPDVKLISVVHEGGGTACFFDLASDPGELRPHCEPDVAPVLRAALASFGGRPRPERAPPSLAAAGEPRSGEAGSRAAN